MKFQTIYATERKLTGELADLLMAYPVIKNID